MGIAIRALTEFLLQVKERPLYAHVARHNLTSLRVLEKCGFTGLAEENEQSEELLLQLSSQQPDVPV